jgi:hypothetical protein
MNAAREGYITNGYASFGAIALVNLLRLELSLGGGGDLDSHKVDYGTCCARRFVRYWSNNGQRPVLGDRLGRD